MYHAGTLGCLPTLVIGPCLDLHLSGGDECLEVEQTVGLLDETVYAALLQSQLVEKHLLVVIGLERRDVFLCLGGYYHGLGAL